VTSAQEAIDLVQEGIGIALLPEGVCRNGVQDVRVMPIQDLKPLELMLIYRSNCSPVAERIAIGIADSVRGDELARTGQKSICQQGPNLSLNPLGFPAET
jgi:DNA-binding transcriptional LysR family regulator